MNGLFRLTVRQILGGRKFWLLGIALCLPILLLTLVQAAGGFVEISDFAELDDPDLHGPVQDALIAIFMYVLYPQVLCILASLIYGASLLVREVEDKTLVYLFSRAQPRWKILLSKYITTVVVLSLAIIASMSICFLIAGMPMGVSTWCALAATIATACAAYTAIFALLGIVLPNRSMTIGLIYAIVVEFMLTFVPALINGITVSHYLRSLAIHISDPENLDEFTGWVTTPSLPGTLTALALFPLVSLIMASVVIHHREWPLNEGV